jgi:hypothetical protein
MYFMELLTEGTTEGQPIHAKMADGRGSLCGNRLVAVGASFAHGIERLISAVVWQFRNARPAENASAIAAAAARWFAQGKMDQRFVEELYGAQKLLRTLMSIAYPPF